MTTSLENNHVVIRIADSGTGIRDEHRSRIFEPFFTTKDAGIGAGQGLAIAHSVIVKQHYGQISFETEVGKGTTFTIRIPLDGLRPLEDETHKFTAVMGCEE